MAGRKRRKGAAARIRLVRHPHMVFTQHKPWFYHIGRHHGPHGSQSFGALSGHVVHGSPP